MTGRYMLAVWSAATFLMIGCASQPTPAPASTPAAPLYEPFAPPYERIQIGEGLFIREVQHHAFVITQEGAYAANSMLVEMPDGSLVLVDTPYTPEATEELLAWIRSTFAEADLIEINTGFHEDNLAGNGLLIARAIPVYGADRTVELLAAHDSPFAPPTHLYPIEQGLELTPGGERVQVYYPGPTHTLDNVVVYFEARKLLFAGCMVSGWGGIGYTGDADMEAWPISLRNLDRFDALLVIPGHGDSVDPGLIEETIELLESAG